MNAESSRLVKAATGPPLYVRLPVYGFLWLVNGAVLVCFVPQFKAIFAKLEAKGELPDLTGWMMAFVRMSEMGFYVPYFAIVLAFLAFDAGIVAILRHRKHRSLLIWLWFLLACGTSISVLLFIVYGLLLPVFKMSSTVG